MANNLVVQLLLKSGSFSNDLKHAGGQVNQFKQKCSSAGKTLTSFTQGLGINVGALAKFGTAAGAAVVAAKAFKGIIEGSQTTSDTFANSIYTAKNAVSELASAISTFDFSSFNNGLSDIIRKGYQAADAIDQLGNTILSYNIINAKANAKLTAARAVLYNPDSTPEQIDQAKIDMKDALDELKASASVLLDDYKNTIIAEVNARGASLSGEGAIAILDEWLEVDTTKGRDAIKAKAKEGYDAYTKALKDLNNRYTKADWVGGLQGHIMTRVDKNNPEYQAEYNKLVAEHQRDIAYHVLLEKYTTQELENLGQQRIAMININSQADAYAATMGRLNNRKPAGGTGGTVTEKDVELLKDSKAYWEYIASEARKAANNTLAYSDAWKEAVDKEEEALAKIKEIDLHLAAYRSRKNFVPLERLPEIKGGFQLGTQTPEVPEVPVQTINSWDSFSQAMANTSTIVSALTDTFRENTEVTAASILQMVATSLPAIGQLIGSIEALTAVEAVEAGVAATGKAVSSSKHWIEAIAAVAALGAVVAAAISNSKAQAQKFATGGIVGGNSFTGDRVSAQVNSGEMILTNAQQARLFRMANGGAAQGGNQVTFHISGQDLVGVLNNQTRKNNIIR